eukprot:Tamp_32241.p2 GENE.Tamp_32241~~Tamp_32241.p2  ORF type:complete len:192 (+),score=17.44 Tamp_32241:60-635(+)
MPPRCSARCTFPASWAVLADREDTVQNSSASCQSLPASRRRPGVHVYPGPPAVYTCTPRPRKIWGRDGGNFGLGSDNSLDAGGWEWMAPGNLTENLCMARCQEGTYLSRFEGRVKCVDRRIRDAWFATYALLWLLVAGAAAFFAWRFYVRPDNRCACGVGWVYRCAEHRECAREAAAPSEATGAGPARGLV